MTKNLKDIVKQVRKERKFTLDKLAKMVGCSKSYISQLENGTTSPSLSMIGRLSAALGIHVSELFQEPHSNNQNKNEIRPGNGKINQTTSYLKKADRRTISYPDGKMTDQLLTNAVYQKTMQPVMTVIQPGGISDDKYTLTHPEGSEEFVLILAGEIEFKLNSEKFTMKEGDSLYFDGATPHGWKNISKKIAKVLFVWTPPVW